MDYFNQTYEIRSKIGEGTGGVVYLAYHKRLEKLVVLKQIKRVSRNLESNRREVDILKNLQHTYLPQVFDFFYIKDKVFTVMSYIPGQSLKQLCDQGYQFTNQQLISWAMQLCLALNYLHSQNPPIIHSDIKPANIMLRPDGNICLIDFNISFFLDGTAMLGYTNGYSSPEQRSIALNHDDQVKLDEKSDIYSIGATLYYLATKKKYDENNPDFVTLINNTSETFTRIIKKALSYNKNDRYQSAYEMYQAFKNMPLDDKRYLSLIKKQRIIQISLTLLLAVSIVLTGLGIYTLKLERVEYYNELVASQKEYRIAKQFDKQSEVFKEARELLPSSLESYYQNALSLYQQDKYQECIEFIDYDVLDNERIDINQDKIGYFYGISGNCYFELEEYQDAVDQFASAVDYLGYDEELYPDYPIALAYNDELDLANEELEKAIEHGLSEDSLYYARGEINKSLDNDDIAIENFDHCLKISDDDELKERAYVLMSDIYVDDQELNKAHDILTEAVDSLPVTYQMTLLERLIQVNIDLNTDASRKEALTYLQQVIDNNWDSYDTYDNIVVLNMKLKDYDQVTNTLDYMLKTYNEDYNIYKRYAFLEIDLQEAKDNSQRSYQQFEKYYLKAKELYQDSKSSNDAEMALLDSLYQQVERGGWL
ncbi:serine/threonine-protein kinase [Thomasclavelia sp.]|uniref:serine/threonine-protein kinase n=1 Tax=Thomasclavelia sp. TaxID=3025757 RepID=UPI0025E4D391|nr:serine/threonine-protein kinase [Thomasclavelia sp.]